MILIGPTPESYPMAILKRRFLCTRLSFGPAYNTGPWTTLWLGHLENKATCLKAHPKGFNNEDILCARWLELQGEARKRGVTWDGFKRGEWCLSFRRDEGDCEIERRLFLII